MESKKKYKLTKITPFYGAIATGIDLSKAVDKVTITQIEADIYKYRTVIFKKQNLSGSR